MPERENPPMIWFKLGKTEGTIGEYRGFYEWEEVIDKIKPLVKNDGMNFIARSSQAKHALECKEFQGPKSIYVYWGDEFGKMENTISDGEIGMLNTAIFQGLGTPPMETNHLTPTIGETTMKIEVPVVFKGTVTVEVPSDLPLEDQQKLAQKIALARVVATTDNPDAPEDVAFDEYSSESDDPSRAEKDWDFSSEADMSVGGSWSLK